MFVLCGDIFLSQKRVCFCDVEEVATQRYRRYPALDTPWINFNKERFDTMVIGLDRGQLCGSTVVLESVKTREGCINVLAVDWRRF
jgi:hypothetical protein